MNFDNFRHRADRVQRVPLESVLDLRHAVRYLRDRQKWHTEQRPVSSVNHGAEVHKSCVMPLLCDASALPTKSSH